MVCRNAQTAGGRSGATWGGTFKVIQPLSLELTSVFECDRAPQPSAAARGTGAADRAALLHTSSRWCLVALTSGATRESSGARRILRATVDARSSACTNSDSLLTTRAVRHDRTTYQHLAYYSRCARVPLDGVG